MDEIFKEIRLSGNLKIWVMDMIETRFEFLKHLDEVIKAPLSRNIHRKVNRLNIDGRTEIVSGPQIPTRSSSKTLEYTSSKQPTPHSTILYHPIPRTTHKSLKDTQYSTKAVQ